MQLAQTRAEDVVVDFMDAPETLFAHVQQNMQALGSDGVYDLMDEESVMACVGDRDPKEAFAASWPRIMFVIDGARLGGLLRESAERREYSVTAKDGTASVQAFVLRDGKWFLVA